MTAPPRPSVVLRGYALVSCLFAATIIVWWLLQHPFGAATMALPIAGYLVVVTMWPATWLVLLPALWPIADLARWTGQIHVTETDALLLATVAGVGLRTSFSRHALPAEEPWQYRVRISAFGVVALLTASVCVAVVRGTLEFPPSGFAAWTGYSGSMNGIRIGKGYLLPLLLLPFLHSAFRREGTATAERLVLGLTLGLGTAALAALWERVAFPGLTDFAADYRTTALFWEMHVGGAALDAWIAITLPFALYGAWIWRESRPVQAVLAAGVCCLGGYALLTTFSRGLYAAAAVIVAILVIGGVSRRAGVERGARTAATVAGYGFAAVIAFAVAMLAFQHGGYRGAAAMVMAAWFTYALGRPLSNLRTTEVVLGLAGGVTLGSASAVLAQVVPKGPYVLFTLGWAIGVGWLLWKPSLRPGRGLRIGLLALFVWVLSAAVLVAWHWGGEQALVGSIIAAMLLIVPLLAQSVSRSPLWTPTVLGKQLVAGLLLASLIASAVFTSFYFSVRAARTGMDMEGRLGHWRHSASLLHTDADLWLGIGAGRFPEAYFWNVPQGLFPGTWEIRSESDNDFLRLGPPRHMRGFGDLFRVSQTVPLDVRGPFIIQFRARAAGKTYARVEICRKHLLYTDDCVIHGTELEGGTDWQTFKAVTEPGDLNRGPWYAPRLAVLSLDLDGGSAADIDDLSVIDGNGHQIVRNGSFQAGPDHWFFTSDRLHLAWHAKNLMLHVLIEHGILGLIALGIACLVALLRLLVAARHGPRLALPVLAGVTGILTVGLFDSVLNVPRITVWFAILLWIALTIRIRMPANTPA